MLKTFWVDLHLHTVLSPCAELEMGAAEIVAKCRDENISLIAVTDHNHVANFSALRDAADGNPVVLPGLEVQSMEDIHTVAVFRDGETALQYKNWLWLKMPDIKNNEEIFGYQLIIDKDNDVIDQEETLLIQGASRSVDEIAGKALSMGGIVLMAHVDRPTFSYEAVLGRIPDSFECTGVELSCNVSHAEIAKWKERYPTRVLVRSSDSHRLERISRSHCTPMRLEKPSFDEIMLALQNKDGRYVEWGSVIE